MPSAFEELDVKRHGFDIAVVWLWQEVSGSQLVIDPVGRLAVKRLMWPVQIVPVDINSKLSAHGGTPERDGDSASAFVLYGTDAAFEH